MTARRRPLTSALQSMGRLQSPVGSLLGGRRLDYMWTHEWTEQSFHGHLFYHVDDLQQPVSFKYGQGGFSYVAVPLQQVHLRSAPEAAVTVRGVELQLNGCCFSAFNRRFSLQYPLQEQVLEVGNKGILLYGARYFMDDQPFFTVDHALLKQHPHLYDRVMFVDGAA